MSSSRTRPPRPEAARPNGDSSSSSNGTASMTRNRWPAPR
jgi:hypothetical protein